jgi:formate dehydrogenase subunit gamma
MEAALDGMITGEVDETWAKEHHDLWYEDVKGLPENQPGYDEKLDAESKGKASQDNV